MHARIPFDDAQLWAFIAGLAQDGYPVGMQEFLRVQLLLTKLAEAGALPDDPRHLAGRIGPLLCGTRSQQLDFALRFDIWIGPLIQSAMPRAPSLSKSTAAHSSSLEARLRAAQRWALAIRVARWMLLLIVVEELFRGWLQAPSQQDHDASAWDGRMLPSSGIAAATVLIGLALYVLLRQGVLHRRLRLSSDQIAQLDVGPVELASSWVAPPDRYALAQMRQRVALESDELDVASTAIACAHAGGQWRPVYAMRSRLPEYLVLVERQSPADVRAARASDIVRQFRRAGIFAVMYYFDGDPRLLFAEDGNPVRLRQVQAEDAAHRLLLCTEASALVDAYTGRPRPWAASLALWTDRTLLTLVPEADWGPDERCALSLGFKLLPCTPPGFSASTDARLAQRLLAESREAYAPRYPDGLLEDELAWVGSNAPRPSTVRTGLDNVRRYLGDDGYNCLSACAVYPEVRPGLTRYLLSQFASSIHRPAIAARMSRLPWMRHAFMPDWLRAALLDDMPRAHERRTRRLLREALRPATSSSEMTIAASGGLTAVWHWLRHGRENAGEADAPMQDRVYLAWMANRLSMRIPRRLWQWISGRRSASRAATPSLDSVNLYKAREHVPLRGAVLLALFLPAAIGFGAFVGAVTAGELSLWGAVRYTAAMFFGPILTAMLCGWVLRAGHIRGERLEDGILILTGLAFLCGNWLGWGNSTLDRMPDVLQVLRDMRAHASWLTGTRWILEAALIMFFTYAGASTWTRTPYCETCRSWTTETERLYGPLADDSQTVADLFRGMYTRVFALARVAPHATNSSHVLLHQCTDACRVTTLLTLTERSAQRNGEMLVSKSERELVRRLYVDAGRTRDVAAWIHATLSIRFNLVPPSKAGLHQLVEVLLPVVPLSKEEFSVYGDIQAKHATKAREKLHLSMLTEFAALGIYQSSFPIPWCNLLAFTVQGAHFRIASTTTSLAYAELVEKFTGKSDKEVQKILSGLCGSLLAPAGVPMVKAVCQAYAEGNLAALMGNKH